MWDKIKQWPASVKLAVVCLVLVWGFAFTLAPIIMMGFTIVGVVIASFIRIVSYFIDGN